MNEAEYGTEEICPKHAAGHEPNWNTVTVEADGGTVYLDVCCKHCGRSGCITTIKRLEAEVAW